MRTTPSSATKEMNKVMGRLRRGSSFKAEDLEGVGSSKGGKSGPIPVPSPWASQLRTRDCSPSLEEDSPEGSSSTLSRSEESLLAELSLEFVSDTWNCCCFVPPTLPRCGTPSTEQGEKSSGGTPCSKLS